MEDKLESVTFRTHDYHVLGLVSHEVPTFFAADSFIAHDRDKLVFDPRNHYQYRENQLGGSDHGSCFNVNSIKPTLVVELDYPI